jgi:hypothetical protein
MLPIREGFQFIGRFPYILANFDGVHYMNIATRGYVTEGAFFPLYPLLIKLSPFWFGIIISNLSILIAVYFLVRLLRIDYPRKTIAWTIIFLLVFPTAFFFHAVYSESLFLLLVILSFYLARQGRWFWALVVAMFLCATRLVGIFIVPALMVEWWQQKRDWRFLPLLFLPSLSTIGYSLFNYYKWGDWLYFLHAHGQLANGRSTDSIIFPGQTLFRYWKILTTISPQVYEWWIALLELGVFVGGCYLLYLGFKQKIRLPYLVFSGLCFFLPALSGTFSGLPRYLIVCFPVFIVLGAVKSRVIKIFLATIFFVLQIILLTFFARGYFVA